MFFQRNFNMRELPMGHDRVIFSEMMTHPALFTHRSPQKIALINPQNDDILREILKHPTVKTVHLVQENLLTELNDPRIHTQAFIHLEPETFDVVIHVNKILFDPLPNYFKLLKKEGLLVQQSNSFFELELMKEHMQHLKNNGFSDFNLLHFPQSTGLQSAIMAIKQGDFKRVSEKIIYNKSFSTNYYNFDIHKAAMVLPEFIRKEDLISAENCQ